MSNIVSSELDQDSMNSKLFGSFSSKKRKILLLLKREKELDLETLSVKLEISKMGALKHVKELEEMGLVDRLNKKVAGAGRPRLVLTLATGASDIFPRAYFSLTNFALKFIEENMGRPAIEQLLRSRQKVVYKEYHDTMHDLKTLGERVKELTKLRDKEGYMAELHVTSAKNYELLEYNCPIFNVAEKYQEACMVERELFEELLDADVETSHRVVAGDNVCRFFIKKRN